MDPCNGYFTIKEFGELYYLLGNYKDLHSFFKQVVTASEDNHLFLWAIYENKVELIDSQKIKDSILTGIQFTNNGSMVFCVAYERQFMLCWNI